MCVRAERLGVHIGHLQHNASHYITVSVCLEYERLSTPHDLYCRRDVAASGESLLRLRNSMGAIHSSHLQHNDVLHR